MIENESIQIIKDNLGPSIDPNMIVAIETGILVIVTGIYAFFTYKIISEQQRDRKLRWIEKQLEECYLPLYSDLKFFVDKEFEDLEKRRNSPDHIHMQYDKYRYILTPEIRKALDAAKNISEVTRSNEVGKIEIDPKIKAELDAIENIINELKEKHQSLLGKL